MRHDNAVMHHDRSMNLIGAIVLGPRVGALALLFVVGLLRGRGAS